MSSCMITTRYRLGNPPYSGAAPSVESYGFCTRHGCESNGGWRCEVGEIEQTMMTLQASMIHLQNQMVSLEPFIKVVDKLKESTDGHK